MVSKRLKAITELIDPNFSLADIGTDHGIIPVEALKNNFTENIVATDINPKPLSRAKDYLSLNNYDNKVELRTGNGLEPLKKGEVGQIVIAGMGGELIAKIIEDDLEKALDVEQLILQPMTKVEVLRQFLLTHGFNIAKDLVIEDNQAKRKHFFHILVVNKKEGRKYSPDEILFGPADEVESNDYRNYLKHEIDQYRKRIESMEKSNDLKTNKRRLEYERRFQYLKELIK